MNIEQDLKKDYQKKASNYFELERHEMLKYVPEKAGNILDVGCGTGNFGRLLKEKLPVKVWGVEFNEDAATQAAQKLDRVICGSFNSSLNLPKNEFDCIIFNDVLEHLADPYTALVYSKYLLRKGGLVIASIPNIRHFDTIWDLLVNKNWQYTDSGILDRTHLRFFTQRSIVNTFNELGYSIIQIEGINGDMTRYPRKFRLLNLLLFNQIEDMRYYQFAVVATPLIYE